MTELISIKNAEQKGITKLRLDRWSNVDEYIEFDMINGAFGPWVKLWSPANVIAGYENPHMMLITVLGDLNAPWWRPLPRQLKS